MSELSDGQGATGKGGSQTVNHGGSAGKRRRKKNRRQSRPSSKPGAALSAEETGSGLQEQSVRQNAPPDSGLADRAGSGRRKRRRSTRPGNKHARKASSDHDVSSASVPRRQTPDQERATAQHKPSDRHRHQDKRKRHASASDHRQGKSHVYAALDLGTNNCRLLMAVPRQKGRFRVIDGFSRIVRLGEGLSHTGRLGEAAMDRAVEALKQCATKLGNRQVRRSRLIATEACRQAENGQEFLDRVLAETGLELEIVTRETEARLAAEGCGSLMDQRSDAAVMFDIGGGSTELILVNGKKVMRGRIRDRIGAWTSLPMGVVTLAERFGGREVSRDLFSQMIAAVREEIERFEDGMKFQSHIEDPEVHLLGTSGTVTTLAGIHLGLQRYERRRVDGLWMTADEIDSVTSMLLDMDYEQRRQNPCIGHERADLVLAGCAILEAIRETWPADRLRVADRGLREGLLTEMMNSDRVWRSGWSRRRNQKRGDAAE